MLNNIARIQRALDDEEVGRHHEVHQLLRRNLDEGSIPLGHDIAHVAALQRSLDLRQRVVQVVLA